MATGKSRLAALKNMEIEEETPVSLNAEPWKQFLDPVDKTPARQEIAIATSDDVQHLDQLIPLTLQKIHKIIKDTPLVPEDEDYIPNAKLVLAAASSVMNAQIKVDENQLRRRKQEDILIVLKALQDEERKQALLEVVLAE